MTDPVTDAEPDVAQDVAPDVEPDVAPDVAPDVVAEAAPDVVPDAAPEAAPGALPRADGLPTRTDAAAPTEVSPLEIARKAVEAAEDKKAADIVLLDVTGLTTIADYFVICSGGSERQLAAIVDSIVERVHEMGVRPYSREGAALSHWLLLDLGSVIVHVLAPPERDFYQLERLWAQARTVVRVQ